MAGCYFVLVKWGASSFETVKPLNVSTPNRSFSFSSQIIFLRSEGSYHQRKEGGNQLKTKLILFKGISTRHRKHNDQSQWLQIPNNAGAHANTWTNGELKKQRNRKISGPDLFNSITALTQPIFFYLKCLVKFFLGFC